MFHLISFSNFDYKTNCCYFHIDSLIFHRMMQSTQKKKKKSLQFHRCVYPCFFMSRKLDQNSPVFQGIWTLDLGFGVSDPPLLLIDMVFPVATVVSCLLSHFRKDPRFLFSLSSLAVGSPATFWSYRLCSLHDWTLLCQTSFQKVWHLCHLKKGRERGGERGKNESWRLPPALLIKSAVSQQKRWDF